MELIQSFTIDHRCLLPGIYVSRKTRGTRKRDLITTFDLRFFAPSSGRRFSPASAHSIEHLMATWFRNSKVKSDVVYVGMMACSTGAYLIMRGDYDVWKIRELVIECIYWISKRTKVPGVSKASCGHYRMHNLQGAQRDCISYLCQLKYKFNYKYKKLEIRTSDGDVFADA